jgi:hypothetical protein
VCCEYRERNGDGVNVDVVNVWREGGKMAGDEKACLEEKRIKSMKREMEMDSRRSEFLSEREIS